MKGILKLAYKLLVNDKAKFTALLVGLPAPSVRVRPMTNLRWGG